MVEELFIESLGAYESEPDIRDYKIAGTSLAEEYPDGYELPMPPVKNQGAVSSCVAHAIALTAEYFNSVQLNINEPLSVGYIYGNRVFPLTNGKGMTTRFAIANFCADGTPFEVDFPTHCEVPEIITAVKEKKDQLHDKASKFRFTSYVKVAKEKEIKTALMSGSPVIIAVNWYKDMKVRDGKVVSSFAEKRGGHALVLYGWNKEGWLIQNSWGEYWGNQGCAIYPYDYPIREAFAIIDMNTSLIDIEKPFAASSKFMRQCVRILNKLYCFFYRISHKWKN